MKFVVNPARALGMQSPEIVVRFGEREEIAALVAAADAMGRPEIGDMVILGVWTGQRQGDRLAMVEHSAELVRGRRMLKQRKTGAIVACSNPLNSERASTQRANVARWRGSTAITSSWTNRIAFLGPATVTARSMPKSAHWRSLGSWWGRQSRKHAGGRGGRQGAKAAR